MILREQADLIKELSEVLKLKATARPTKAAEIVCGKALRKEKLNIQRKGWWESA